jgi:cytochrome P450
MDAPEHTRLRKLVARAFTVRRVEALHPRAADVVTECLAGMRATGSPADLVAHLCVPLPVTIICELLGVPPQDRDVFRAGADAALSTTSITPDERREARDTLRGYMPAWWRSAASPRPTTCSVPWSWPVTRAAR